MKALILNSGLGSRLGEITKHAPKCLTKLLGDETILLRQLKILEKLGVKEVVITTGYLSSMIEEYCNSLSLDMKFTFVENKLYNKSNYIYSMNLAQEYLRSDDFILMHGDLVFEDDVLNNVASANKSCVVVSSSLELPEKDFKAVISDNLVKKIGIEFFESAMACQPLYFLKQQDFKIWLDNIELYCDQGNVNCYAENAFNDVSEQCKFYPLDIKDKLCSEIDNVSDLERIRGILNAK